MYQYPEVNFFYHKQHYQNEGKCFLNQLQNVI